MRLGGLRLGGSILLALVLLAACGPADTAPEAAPTANAPDSMTPQAAGPSITDANKMSLEQIGAKLAGTFQYADDDKSMLTITSSGEWTETYEGAESATANWRVFAGTDAPKGVEETFTPASRYVEVTGESGSFYYELGHVSDDGFDMFYVARGNRLSYVRVKMPA